MIVQQTIEQKLLEAFELVHLQILNESGNHSVAPGSETHFKVIAVSDDFLDLNKVARHRAVNRVLKDELAGPVHALSLQLFSKQQWADAGGVFAASPLCASKKSVV